MKGLKYSILILFVLLIHPKLTFSVNVEAYPYTRENLNTYFDELLKYDSVEIVYVYVISCSETMKKYNKY